MKYSKRIASIALSAIIAASVATTTMSMGAFAVANPATGATSTVNITLTDSEKHTMVAYQIFSGEIETQTKPAGSGTATGSVLTNIQWGSAFGAEGANTGDNFLVALKADATIGGYFNADTVATAQDVADIIGGSKAGANSEMFKTNEAANLKALNACIDNFFSGETTPAASVSASNETGKVVSFADLTDGYYFFKDSNIVDGNSDGVVNASYTKFILRVVGGETTTLEVAAKSELPSMVKKVKENNNAVSGQPAFDTNYTIPDDYNDVADYTIGDTIPFQIVGSLPENFADYEGYYYKFTDTLDSTLTVPETVTVTIKDGLTTYEIPATQSESINYTFTANANGFTVEFADLKNLYSANGSKVTLTDDAYVIVDYNSKLKANAVIGRPGQVNKADLTYSNNPNYSGNDYSENTGKTPEDKNIVFTYGIEVIKKADEANGNIYLDAGFVLKNATGQYAKFSKDDGAYTFTEWFSPGHGFELNETTATDNSLLFNTDSDADGETSASTVGKALLNGLDEGTYTLVEVVVPDGYNKAADVEIVISADTLNNGEWTTNASEALTRFDSREITANENSDCYKSATVINKSGSSLPETGGIGTTIFYVVGGTAVVGASILLIAKKRANNK